MIRKFILLTGVLLFFAAASALLAGEGRLQFVETEVMLLPDGKASIEYVVRYAVVSGEFHGFYFGGLDRLVPHFDLENASAIDSRDNTYGLDIKKVRSDYYDIILEKGQGVLSGHVTYRFRFAADMSLAGYLAPTTAAGDRKLVVFNWAPTEWDQALEHYTVKVIYPIVYTSAREDRSSIEEVLLARGFATERWMNQEYKIDYRLRKVGEESWIEVLLHKDSAHSRYRFRIQQYVNADVFPEMSAPDTPRGAVTPSDQRTASTDENLSPKKKGRSSRWSLVAGFLAMLLSSLFAVSRKHRSMVRAQSELDQVKWVREDWEPPKIELASFRTPGKIAKDLDPVEAGVFIGVPYKQIFSTILSQLVSRNCLQVLSRDPLLVEIVRPMPVPYSDLSVYEQKMYQAARDDGQFSEQELNGLLKEVVHNIQQKAWDCDIEATKNHYQDRITEAFKEIPGEPLGKDDRRRLRDDPAGSWWYWYHYNYGMHRHYDPHRYDHDFEASLP
ncbi:MAG: hypothetical protein JXB23_05925, partial [Candidatus Aminicenantes bacterium]|nr:hypothetical protein [Candidatus Aminicenantes bacterium]